MDSVGFPWTPSDSIRKMGIGGYHRTTFLPSLKVLRIEFCLFHRKKYISHGCVLEMYGKKSISTLPNRELGKCNEIRNNRDLISGEV